MDNETMPAGMVPWHGGDAAPADWDGGPVMLRYGGEVIRLEEHPRRWQHPYNPVGWVRVVDDRCECDIIAYTPRTPVIGGEQAGQDDMPHLAGYIEQLGTPNTLDHAVRERDAWVESAAQFSRNEDYYRGLLDEIAAHIGPEAYRADNGDEMDSPVRARLPELIARLTTSPDNRQAESGAGEASKCCGEYIAGSRCPACPDRPESYGLPLATPARDALEAENARLVSALNQIRESAEGYAHSLAVAALQASQRGEGE